MTGTPEATRVETGNSLRDEQGAPRAEAALLGRYLLRCEPEPEVAARFEAGCRRLFGAASPADEAVVRFAVRHPWSLPFLDAASGLAAPDSLLRRKIFLMFAVLETDPRHAEAFAAVPAARAWIVLKVGARALAGALKAAAGLALLPVARRAR